MSDVIHHKQDEECICDICIDAYIDLYNKIETLQEVRLRWLSNMTKKEKDRLNVLLKPKEKEKEKEKKEKKKA